MTTAPDAPTTTDAPTPNEGGYVWSNVTSARATDVHTVLVPMRPSEADAVHALYAVWANEMDQRKCCGFRHDTFAFWLRDIAIVRGGRALVDRGALQDAGGPR